MKSLSLSGPLAFNETYLYYTHKPPTLRVRASILSQLQRRRQPPDENEWPAEESLLNWPLLHCRRVVVVVVAVVVVNKTPVFVFFFSVRARLFGTR